MSPVEPNADLRKLAAMAFELYQALLQAGFSEEQAFALAKEILLTQIT